MNSRRAFFSSLLGAAVASCVRWLPMPEKPEPVRTRTENHSPLTMFQISGACGQTRVWGYYSKDADTGVGTYMVTGGQYFEQGQMLLFDLRGREVITHSDPIAAVRKTITWIPPVAT